MSPFGNPRLRADFNNARPDGSIRTTARYAETLEPLRPGLRVQLRDDDGNVVTARILSIQGAAVNLAPDWSTWVDAHESLSVTRLVRPERFSASAHGEALVAA